MLLREVDHVGIAVEDLEASVEEYRRVFGVEPAHRERVEYQGVDEVLFRVGTSFIQLLGSLGPDTPVGRFLARRGEGIHHIAYKVDDVAEALARARESGIETIDEKPRTGGDGRTNIGFLHPRSTFGVLTELEEDVGKS